MTEVIPPETGHTARGSQTQAPEEEFVTTQAEEHIAVATQWQLMWWRFRKHRLAIAGVITLFFLYLVALSADFLAYTDPQATEAERSVMPPQSIHWMDDDRFSPHVYRITGKRDPKTFKRVYELDLSAKFPVRFFTKGFEYKWLGIIPSDIHLVGVEGAPVEETLSIMGTDMQGRDLWSRLMYGTRTSLSIGLTSVALSLILGIVLGGISGYYGGVIDTIIQRIIEILRSIPTIPLWLGLTAALPGSWSVGQVYFAITVIISLLGWTGLARTVRGRFLSLREEDFVMAARLSGCSRMRIILRHMVPSFLSHIIASTTLALPAMIISETALSFLGLGLRPPAISWGVLLQDAQNIQALAISPWLLIPSIPVIIAVLSFNFVGDGLRDAADPYG
jgi:peptide/nickel transport system permease protein